MYLNQEEALQQQVEEQVCDVPTDAVERLSYVLQHRSKMNEFTTRSEKL